MQKDNQVEELKDLILEVNFIYYIGAESSSYAALTRKQQLYLLPLWLDYLQAQLVESCIHGWGQPS